MLKKIILISFICIYSSTLFANPARITSMGKSDLYFMDEMSIFRNPANVSIYSNMLVGDFGRYMDTTKQQSFYLENRDPDNPWYGGTIGLGGSGEDNVGMLSLGCIVNKQDKYDTLWFNHNQGLAKINKYKPQVPLDIFVSYNFGRIKVGGRLHYGEGEYKVENKTITPKNVTDYSSLVMKGLLGVRAFIGEDKELEVSGGGVLNKIDTVSSDSEEGTNQTGYIGHTRLFSDMGTLGDIVLAAGYEDVPFIKGENFKKYYGGIGFNLLIDRGFLWFGFTGINEKLKIAGKEEETTAGALSFGIERNVWWDWFIMRLGGNKMLGRRVVEKVNNEGVKLEQTQYYTNPNATKMPNDALGFGLGLNIENRLRFDAVVAEDILHTGTALMSGSPHHVFTKLSGTLTF